MLSPEQKKIVEENIGLAYDFVIRAKKSGHTLYIAKMDDDDMLSIAFYALCVAAEVFDRSLGYAFSTLYHRICVNEFSKILRQVITQKHGPYYSAASTSESKCRLDDVTVEDTIKDESPGPEEIYFARVEVDVLHKAIDALDETLRHTVRMYYFRGLEQKDIACAHGIQQPGVSRRLDRAHRKIAAHMAANGFCS